MAFCTAILGIPAIIFTAKKVSLALNGSTTASWRCGWIALEHEGEVVVEGMLEGMVVESSSSVPRDFGRMCRESVSSSQILRFFLSMVFDICTVGFGGSMERWIEIDRNGKSRKKV